MHAVNGPLICCGGVRARLGSELLNAMEQPILKAPSFDLPLLHGRNDSLILPEGSEDGTVSVCGHPKRGQDGTILQVFEARYLQRIGQDAGARGGCVPRGRGTIIQIMIFISIQYFDFQSILYENAILKEYV